MIIPSIKLISFQGDCMRYISNKIHPTSHSSPITRWSVCTFCFVRIRNMFKWVFSLSTIAVIHILAFVEIGKTKWYQNYEKCICANSCVSNLFQIDRNLRVKIPNMNLLFKYCNHNFLHGYSPSFNLMIFCFTKLVSVRFNHSRSGKEQWNSVTSH